MEHLFDLVKYTLASVIATVGIAQSSVDVSVNNQVETTSVTSQVTTQSTQTMMTKTGEMEMFGQKVRYTLSFPKEGGDITGKFDGSCEGVVTGVYSGEETNDINGKLSGNCLLGIVEQPLEVNYTGKANLGEGKLDITYDAKLGLVGQKGSTILDFITVK